MADDSSLNMETRDVVQGIRWQAEHSRRNDAPITARIVEGLAAVMRTDTLTGRRIAGWQGMVLEDAMPLRLAGGLHHLSLTGADRRLDPIYRGEVTGQAAVDAIVCAVVADHDERLAPWLDGPPQTNEAGRSASIMAALLWLSPRLGPRFELNELGASAGANTMIDRYAYDLGGTRAGPESASVRIVPEWRGPAPVPAPVEIVAIAGCDQAPIDLTDPDQALRLKSYVWPENIARLDRLDRVIAEARARRPDLVAMDAADWVDHRLARPQPAGVTRVVYHSIVWQYIPPEGRARIATAMEAAGARAAPDRSIAWIMLETNRQTFRHELRVRYWPGGDWALLGEAQAHGAWVEWFGDPSAAEPSSPA